MSEAVKTLDGWWSLHLLYSVDWSALRMLTNEEQDKIVTEFEEFLSRSEAVSEKKEGDHTIYNITGQKADILLWFLRPTVEELNNLENELNKLQISDFLIPEYSYFSAIEMSSYLAKDSDEDPYENPYVRSRLYPELMDAQYCCFYPMDKKRELDDNWYMLPIERRRELMRDHGMIGRQYAGKIKQYILGSQGLDLYEWGVMLLSDDMLEFKNIIYEMRFDETSARYGVFGDFYVGVRLRKDDLKSFFRI